MVVTEWEEIVTVLRAELEAGKGWGKFVKNGICQQTTAGVTVRAGLAGMCQSVLAQTRAEKRAED